MERRIISLTPEITNLTPADAESGNRFSTWTHEKTCAVMCSHEVRLGEGTLICLCSASPLVWWEMVPWTLLPCCLAVVRRLCCGIVMNSAYLISSRGFPSHFIHTVTCILSLVFGQWKKGKRSSEICICLVQSFSLLKGLAPI